MVAPKTVSPRKQATQDALIQAAYLLFSQKGFGNTTTREIAETAGVSELTLFRHFHNKYNLLSAVIAQHASLEELEQAFREMETEADTFEAGFHAMARVFLRLLQDKYPMIRLMIIEATSNPELKLLVGPIPVKLRQMLMKHLQRGVAEGKIRSDLNLELVAQSFLWVFMSYVITRSDVGQKFCPFPSEEVAVTSTNLFLRGLHP